MHICIDCKHHRKEGSKGIRCHARVVTRIVRNPVTGVGSTVQEPPPQSCETRRNNFLDTCPDFQHTVTEAA
ncbi:hypothetical protein LMG10661_00792 [Ralstonia syzygii subsp. syzygii]|nr:hypothetical protein LMG10661_00792 [Ralstonia syzygii subsp. syzygii]